MSKEGAKSKSNNIFLARRIPQVVITRLSIYSRVLTSLLEENVKVISSIDLAKRADVTAAQIRKDLASFGQFGTRGSGYEVSKLKQAIDRILGLDIPRKVALVGVGNLGSALLGYRGLRDHNFQIVAAFDTDVKKIGAVFNNVLVYDFLELKRIVEEKEIEIGIIAVPAAAAQDALDQLVSSGVRAILNFAPARLQSPPSVKLKNVDLSIELESLSYFLNSNQQSAIS